MEQEAAWQHSTHHVICVPHVMQQICISSSDAHTMLQFALSGLTFAHIDTCAVAQIETVAYTHSLKELTLTVNTQQAITKDNVTIRIDGVLYIRITDAFKASYGVDRPLYAVMQLAQTSMRSELGKMSLDSTFEERDALNDKIVRVINAAARTWGLECLRYEIKDIVPPPGIVAAMELQAEAERRKRAQVRIGLTPWAGCTVRHYARAPTASTSPASACKAATGSKLQSVHALLLCADALHDRWR